MTLQERFGQILADVRGGGTAQHTLSAEGAVYVRRFCPRERLILLGCGHVSQALCGYGADLGFSVIAADDRPSFANRARFPAAEQVLCDSFENAIRALHIGETDYVAILTRGHRYDADCLRAILPGPFPRYLGMIGSKRRVEGLKELLTEEGFDPALLSRLHAPIGLPIQALTLPEIAIAIAAELIQCRRADSGRLRRSEALTEEGYSLPLLEFLAEDPTPKALITVCETAGSTPVKSGAMMAVDALNRTEGSVGGGCGEAQLLQMARRIIGTGTRRLVTVSMTNDVAAQAGMVCGGEMKVMIEDGEADV